MKTAEVLVTTKVTMKTLRLIRRIVARTGEKQYRAWERIVEAEYDSVENSLSARAAKIREKRKC